MSHISHTTLYTKNKDLAFEFFDKYKDRADVIRQINLYPDANDNYCVTITYNK